NRAVVHSDHFSYPPSNGGRCGPRINRAAPPTHTLSTSNPKVIRLELAPQSHYLVGHSRSDPNILGLWVDQPPTPTWENGAGRPGPTTRYCVRPLSHQLVQTCAQPVSGHR